MTKMINCHPFWVDHIRLQQQPAVGAVLCSAAGGDQSVEESLVVIQGRENLSFSHIYMYTYIYRYLELETCFLQPKEHLFSIQRLCKIP